MEEGGLEGERGIDGLSKDHPQEKLPAGLSSDLHPLARWCEKGMLLLQQDSRMRMYVGGPTKMVQVMSTL